MTLQEYLQSGGAKYAVISALAYYNFPVATELATDPRIFSTDSMAYAILSLKDAEIPMLVGYIGAIGFGIEFEFTEGTGRVSLLTHQQTIDLLAIYSPEPPDEVQEV